VIDAILSLGLPHPGTLRAQMTNNAPDNPV
jgi:hypothetical protein